MLGLLVLGYALGDLAGVLGLSGLGISVGVTVKGDWVFKAWSHVLAGLPRQEDFLEFQLETSALSSGLREARSVPECSLCRRTRASRCRGR